MLKFIRFYGWLILLVLLPAAFARESDWQVAKSTHFIVFYKNAPSQELDGLLRRAEDCYNSIGEQFGFNRFNFWTWDKRAKIYLFDTQAEYMQATASSSWSGGQVHIGSKLIQSYVGAPGFLEDVLPHELAHIIFVEMVGYNNPAVPVWLQEGVATYQQKDIRLIKEDLAEVIRQGENFNLNAMNNFRLDREEEDSVRLFYAQAYSMVSYLISVFGKDEFVDFCRALRDTHNLPAALSKTYSFRSLGDFEQGWKEYILK